jgi:hypothetical protein
MIAVLEDLNCHGIVLSVAAGKLRVDVPRGTLTEALRRKLLAHKAELLAALAATTVQAAQSVSTPAQPEVLSHTKAEDAVERFTERAAILEFDAELPREEAEACAERAVFQGRHAYHFTLSDYPAEAPVVVCDETTVEAARRSLESRFGEGRVIGCWWVGGVRP